MACKACGNRAKIVSQQNNPTQTPQKQQPQSNTSDKGVNYFSSFVNKFRRGHIIRNINRGKTK